MLSLPPAFVLSQDQTLKFETARCPSFNKQQLIALRTFDEMPCGPDVSTKAFGNSLKKRIRPFVSSGPRLPQDPLDSHAACVSLSLSTMSISSGRQKPPKPQTRSAQNTRSPSQDTRQSRSTCRTFGTKAAAPSAPRPLSDAAYRRTSSQLSSITIQKTA